jgi:hypothetical protein
MDQRGRKSTAQLSVVQPDGLISIRRPDPPAELDEAEARVWVSVVNSQEAEWFRPETHPLLVEYCRCTCELNYLSAWKKRLQAECGETKDFKQVSEMQSTARSQLNALARSMRLTQQSTYSARKSKPAMTLTLPPLK